jgi:hypothetical protein
VASRSRDAFLQALLDSVQTDASGFTKLCYNGSVKEPIGSEDGVDMLRRVLRMIPKLSELRLLSCKLGHLGGAHLGFHITLDQSLVILDLSRNNLKTEGCMHIAKALRSCPIEKVRFCLVVFFFCFLLLGFFE